MRRRWGILLALAALLGALPAGAQISFDAVSVAGGITSGSTLSWSHTTASGPNRLIVVACGRETSSGTPPAVSSVSYAGEALTEAIDASRANIRSSIWYRVAPATGSNTVSVTLASAPNNGAACVAATYQGVDQSSPIGNVTTATGTATSSSVSVTVSENSWLVSGIAMRFDETMNGTSGTTKRAQDGNTFMAEGLGDRGPLSAGSQSVSWSWTSNAGFAHAAAEIKAAPSGAARRRVVIP